MKTFLLQPDASSRGDADWSFSTHRGTATFDAPNERWARVLATAAFLAPRTEGGPRPRSPWMRPELVAAVEVSPASVLLAAAA